MDGKYRNKVRHIAIIMDGNGRWAKKRGLPRSAGHVRGADVFKTVAEYCARQGLEALTVYAFSTENWKRSEEEVKGIMDLLEKYLKNSLAKSEEGFRIRFIGRRDRIDPRLLSLIDEVEKDAAANDGMRINIALDYGGRDEIVTAARKLAEEAAAGRIAPQDITEESFGGYMFTRDCPDVDFILRPSGEQRISNFLLWQAAYSEFIFMDTLWPDFTPELLDSAVEEFCGRSRRYGG